MSPDDLVNVSVTHRDGITVLTVAGEIDMATAPVLESAIGDVRQGHPPGVVIDLSSVRFLASAGLQLLLDAHEKVSQWGWFAVVADGPATSRPITLTGLNEVFALYPTLDEALTAVPAFASSPDPTPTGVSP